MAWFIEESTATRLSQIGLARDDELWFPSFYEAPAITPVHPYFYDGTGSRNPLIPDAYQSLLIDVNDTVRFAELAYPEIDRACLENARREAVILVKSDIFDEKILPDVSIDYCGEIIFSHISSSGYVDIGVRGKGELSYHVRNDVEPSETRFGDFDWSEFNIPRELEYALTKLKEQL